MIGSAESRALEQKDRQVQDQRRKGMYTHTNPFLRVVFHITRKVPSRLTYKFG
jgi:hypothetical protein